MPETPDSRRTSLGQITHELHKRRGPTSPQSEADSFVLESKQYVQDIQARRDNIHASLLRGSAPGDRLRRMLGFRLEQRLIKVSHGLRKNKTSTKKRPKNKKQQKPSLRLKSPQPGSRSRAVSAMLQRCVRQTPGLLRLLSKPLSRTPLTPDTELHEDDDTEPPLSPSSTPRFIVDRQGAFRWPPISVTMDDTDSALSLTHHHHSTSTAVTLNTTDNFTLARPNKTNSEDGPSVLGWLQVNTDSHVFTPAIASSTTGTKEGPFKKAPFHTNMHVLQTKI